MNVYYGTMTTKGQTTVPAEVRDILKLKSGDRIRYLHRGDDEVVIKAKNKRSADLAGKFYDPKQAPLNVEQIKEEIGEAAIDRGSRGE